MLTLLLLIPIIGSLLLLPINENELKMKQIALTTSLINLFISLFMWYQFDFFLSQTRNCDPSLFVIYTTNRLTHPTKQSDEFLGCSVSWQSRIKTFHEMTIWNNIFSQIENTFASIQIKKKKRKENSHTCGSTKGKDSFILN